MDIVAVTPLERPDGSLVRALASSSALAVLDLGRDRRAGLRALRSLRGVRFGVRVPEGTGWTAADLPDGVTDVILSAGVPVGSWGDRAVTVEVRTVEEAREAAAAGAVRVIGCGAEGGGRVGPDNAFVLCQRLAAAQLSIPFLVRGGIGPYTAAACRAGGAAGVVLDVQLALVSECGLPLPVRRLLPGADGGETVVLAGYRVLRRPDLPLSQRSFSDPAEVAVLLGGDDPSRQLLPVGQDGALAGPLARRFRTAAGVVEGLRRQAEEALALGAEHAPLAEGSALARELGSRYPITQGPMTRVSDVPAFAAAVAQAGGVPFVALSLLREQASSDLLTETAAMCPDAPWGAGILGFAPPEVRGPQLEAIARVKPPLALIAGGRPSQARELEAQGIPTFLHCPSPRLLTSFLADGARRFVFEGSECGGHVGPRSSFVLWEQQLAELLGHPAVAEARVLFAGGIHDARSAAMISALAGPLAAQGAGVGVLMGTAYLFTEEAVATGAIQPVFQEQALAAARTALVETAPGHATRCVDTPFVEAFEAERARLEAEGVDRKEMWARLEQLNLGRLRIASKGIVRRGQALESVDPETQRAEGMYMIGQVAALRGEVTTMSALHAEVSSGSAEGLAPWRRSEVPEEARPVDIAIIGMASLFPDAPDVDAFWSNILANHDAVREVSADRWRVETYYDPDGVPGETTPSRWGGFLPPVRFEPMRYGLPPRSLVSIDPVQLLSLDVARRALEDAGLEQRPGLRERTSVIFGTESGSDLGSLYTLRAHLPQLIGEVPEALDAVLPRLTEDSFPGVLANVVAGRIANRLDLGGVNYTVDAACGSSLAAVEAGVKELVDGTSDVVICGGADLHNGIHDYLLFSSTHALSPTGRCRTFDASADGIVLGEGVAAVVLRRLEDARRDGDRVLAVIKGVGGSSDGRSLGLTAPRKEGQQRAVTRAWARSGVDPAQLGLVEAHGTGTVVGDRTELRTLEGSFAGRVQGVTLGSVKSQIGHTKCAAGLAGLIKVVHAVRQGVLPGMAAIQQPNAAWDPSASPFEFSSRARPWIASRRVAAVSAFGFGGTNFHAVVEAADEVPRPPRRQPAELFLFRGEASVIRARIDQLSARLDDPTPAPLGALARAVCEAGDGPVGVAVVAEDHGSLRAALSAARAGTPVEGMVWVRGERQVEEGQVAFLFPGQGSQRLHMLSDLFVSWPEAQRWWTLAPELASIVYPADAYDEAGRRAQQASVTDTRVAQPALGVVDLAVADFLEQVGVRASMAGGHSYGELAALVWAGAIPAESLVELSRLRAERILAAAPAEDAGAMAAVRGTEAEVRAALSAHPEVTIANLNAPRQVVISGATPAIEAAVAGLSDAGLAARRLPVACGFHSPVVAEAAQTFLDDLERIRCGPPAVPVWSNVTARPHDQDPASLRARLAEQVASPVRFVEQVENMVASGARLFVEVGPGRVLSGLVRKILAGREDIHVVSMEVPGEPGWPGLLGALAELAVLGVPVDPSALFVGRDLPTADLARSEPVREPVWWVDGLRAWPAQGASPAGGIVPVDAPISLGLSGPGAISGDREQAVLSFLDNMRAMADAQRDVMLGLMGQAPSASGPVLEGRVDAPAAPRRADTVVPVAPAAVPVSARAEAPRSVMEVLLSVVSERTGYPAEMLGPDLDLEADLSIDSIKRIEILNGLGEALGSGVDLGDEALEKLAAQRSLRDIVGQLQAAGVQGEGLPPESSSSAEDLDVMQELLSVVSERTGYPSEMLGPDLDLEADLSIDSIKRIEILNGLGERLGGAVSLDDEALEALAAQRSLRDLVRTLEGHLGSAASATPDASPASTASRRVAPVERYLLRERPVRDGSGVEVPSVQVFDRDPDRADALAAALEAGGISARRWSSGSPDDPVVLVDGAGAIAAFADLKSLLDAGSQRVLGLGAWGDGIEGLFKTAAREYPERQFRLVSLEDPSSVSSLAEAALAELPRWAAGSEVHIARSASGDRVRHVLERAPLGRVDGRLPLDRDSVVLITGGARGITAGVAMALASEVPCTYVLVGRSPMPSVPEPPHLAAAMDDRALRGVLASEGGRKPAEIEAEVGRILKAREMRETVARMEAAGARVEYRALDVRDEDAFRSLVEEIYARWDRLDGAIHGAGLLDDRLMKDKSEQEFARVYETKVQAARVLADALRPEVRFVVFFGSVSGVFGNRGQSDYAAANATLDALAGQLSARIEGRAVSIDWGPWGGAGMVHDALARSYQARGIDLIPVEQGVKACLDELRAGARSVSQVVWQAGDPAAFAERTDG